MVDQLSGGRLEIGFGRGSVPIEIEYYGANPDEAQEIYAEAVDLVLKGLTSKVLDFQGKRFSFRNVPMELAPLQQPHPPIWYGVHMPDSAERAARRNLNVVSLDPVRETRLSIDRYRTIWPQVHASSTDAPKGHAPATPFPKLGLGRFVVVAPTDAEAMALARRAYLVWHASFTHLFRRHDRPQSHPRPATFDLVVERGQGIAGSPKTVTEFLSSQLDETLCNYLVGQFAFGDLTLDESLQSIGLFASEVMPKLRGKKVAADSGVLV
jgi:alkanesulfonate monooxygenase SsuD/methylene tetrahydromethanopterin reductase-like flavin-dependent oxidoreductase (luciferase family)